MNVKLLTSTEALHDMENFAALAALTCHTNTDKEYVPAEALKRIIKAGHESILEHINLTFSIKGLSRACLQELARHRHISLSVESTRHTLRKLFDKSVVLPAANEYAPDFSLTTLNVDSYKQFVVDVLGSLITKHDMSNDELKYFLPEFWPTNLIITLNIRESATFSISEHHRQLSKSFAFLLAPCSTKSPNSSGISCRIVFTMKLTTILTERQVEIFMLLVQGYSQTEIAQILNVSRQTVSKILYKVYAKLEVQNAVEAIRECLLHGLLCLDDMKRKGEEAHS